MSFADIASFFRPMPAPTTDPWSDRDQLAAMGVQPDDKPVFFGDAPERQRYVPAANEIGQWGVWDTRDRQWATFPQPGWLGAYGLSVASDEAQSESEADE